MNLTSKYIEDENGAKFAPISTPNAIRWPDGSNLNDKLSAFDSGKEDVTTIVAPVNATDATLPITSLTTEVGKYYRIDVAVETLAVTLPAMTETSVGKAVVLFLTGGTAPAVTITSTAPAGGTAPAVHLADGFEIKAGETNEVNCYWNGLAWIVAGVKIVISNS